VLATHRPPIGKLKKFGGPKPADAVKKGGKGKLPRGRKKEHQQTTDTDTLNTRGGTHLLRGEEVAVLDFLSGSRKGEKGCICFLPEKGKGGKCPIGAIPLRQKNKDWGDGATGSHLLCTRERLQHCPFMREENSLFGI